MSAIFGESFIAGAWNNFLLLLPMIILFAIGNVLRSVGFFKREDIACMTKLLYWLVSPALLFRGAFNAGSNLSGLSSMFAAMLVCAVLASLTGFILGCTKKGERDPLSLAVSAAAATKPNSIYLGMPTVLLILGDQSMMYISLYAAIGMPLHNILSPVFGEVVSSRSASVSDLMRKSLNGVVKNPLVLASAFGLFFAFAGFRTIPAPVDKMLQLVGSCATGLSLLALGASIKPGEIFLSFGAAWRDVLVRLVIHPALLLLWFSVFPLEKGLVRVIVLMTAMPTAITMFILAEGMKLNSDYAAKLIVATTMFSVVTVPVWSAVLRA